MTRDEFLQLPAAVRLEVIYEVLHDRLVTLPVPTASPPATSTSTSAPAPDGNARPPKYDGKLGRKGGFQWMSEMLLHDLIWWLEKKREGAASGGQYAQRDAKLVTELERWVGWRRVAPAEQWVGVRNDRRVTAAPPGRDPTLHPWGDRAPAKLAPPPPSDGYRDDDGVGIDELPF